MARRTVVDCDNCDKEAKPAFHFDVTVRTKPGDNILPLRYETRAELPVEDMVEVVDLCLDCTAKTLRNITMRYDHQAAEAWVASLRKRGSKST